MVFNLNTPGPPDSFAVVNYGESDFFSASMRPDGQSTTLHCQIAWNDYPNFEATVLGFCWYDGTNIRRWLPLQNYLKPWQYARTVEYVRNLSEPTTDPLNGNHLAYDLNVEVAVGFEAPPGGMLILPDSRRPAGQTNELWRFVARRIEHEVTSQQLPRNALAYANGSLHPNKPIPGVGAVVLATATLYYEVVFPINQTSVTAGYLPQMSGNLEDHLNSGVGCINSAEFDNLYPPYTILALAPKRELVWQADGSLAWKMTYIFAQRGTEDVSASDADSATPDWTRILNGSTDSATSYSRVNRVGAPTKFAYATYDLNKMFQAFPP